MWVYYSLILLSVAMLGGGFALQDVYRRMRGSDLEISMESACIGSFAGLIVLLIVDGFSFEFTPFTLLMATLCAINGIAFTFCAFKSLDYINLSLFSLFAMLGGMVLPFFQGIFFYDESFTLAKGICIVLIFTSLILTVERGKKKKGTFFYIGIFVLNGMSGVLSKIFTESELQKASAAGFSIYIAAVTVLLSGIIWFILAFKNNKAGAPVSVKPDKKLLWSSYGVGALFGAINKIANFLLVIALACVDASVQYPMVTGGIMIVSTILSCFSDKKPNKKEIISVIIAFIAMLVLFFVPI